MSQLSSKADTSAMDELNLDELFGNGDTGKSIFDDEDLIEIGDEIIGNAAIGGAQPPGGNSGSVLAVDISSPAKTSSKTSKRKGALTTKNSITKSKPSGGLKSPPLDDEPVDVGVRKQTKKKKDKVLIAERVEERATNSNANKFSFLPKALPQSLLPSQESVVVERATKTAATSTTSTTPPTTTTEISNTADQKKKVKKTTKRKDSKKKKSSSNDSPNREREYETQLGSLPVPFSQHHVPLWQQQQRQHLPEMASSQSSKPQLAMPKEPTEKKQLTKIHKKCQQDELLPSNTEFFPFVEIPSSINLASRKFSKAFPKLDTIYSTLIGVKGAQSQALSTDPTSTSITEHHSINICKAKDELSKIDQQVLVKELKEVLLMIHRQQSFLHQSNENMQRWCKRNFRKEDYKVLYTSSTVDLFGEKETNATKFAVTNSAAASNSVSLTGDITAATAAAVTITPPTLTSATAQSEKEIPASKTLSTPNTWKNRQTLREKFKSLTTVKAIKIKIICSSFKPPFIFNESTQKKENMKLVAHIIPENVAAEIALKKSSVVNTRKQQSIVKQQQHQKASVYDLRTQITTAVHLAQHRYAKKIRSVAAVFEKKMKDLEDQVEREEIASSITMWRVLEDSYYAIDSFSEYCIAKKKDLIRFALEDIWQPEIPMRVGWKEPPVVRLYHCKEKRKYEETAGIIDVFSVRDKKKNRQDAEMTIYSGYRNTHSQPYVDDANMEPVVANAKNSEENTSNGVDTKAKVSIENGEVENFSSGCQLSNPKVQLIEPDKNVSETQTHEGLDNFLRTSARYDMLNTPKPDVEMVLLQNKKVNESPVTEVVEPAEIPSVSSSCKIIEDSSGYHRIMPSLFDRLQSLLVEVDGWSDGDDENTEVGDDSNLIEEIDEDDIASKSSLANRPAMQRMLDLSQLTLDQRTFIQLRTARLIDTPFLPRTAPMVEESEWVSEEEVDDQLADEVASLQKQLSYLHRSNNETAGFLQHEALTQLSYLEKEYKNREEQAVICAKNSQIVQRRKKEAKQRSRVPATSSKKDTFDSLPW